MMSKIAQVSVLVAACTGTTAALVLLGGNDE